MVAWLMLCHQMLSCSVCTVHVTDNTYPLVSPAPRGLCMCGFSGSFLMWTNLRCLILAGSLHEYVLLGRNRGYVWSSRVASGYSHESIVSNLKTKTLLQLPLSRDVFGGFEACSAIFITLCIFRIGLTIWGCGFQRAQLGPLFPPIVVDDYGILNENTEWSKTVTGSGHREQAAVQPIHLVVILPSWKPRQQASIHSS